MYTITLSTQHQALFLTVGAMMYDYGLIMGPSVISTFSFQHGLCKGIDFAQR